MVQNTPQTEIINKISPLPLSLKISNTGNIDVKGDVKGDDLQTILDISHLRYQLYLNHQRQLDRENNLTVIYIGFIFSFLVALAVFCVFNQSPKFQQSLEVQSYESNV